jgi:hypothetical protein
VVPSSPKHFSTVSDETLKASAFWRRLDTPGTDVARLFQTPTGWLLSGTAVFLHEATRSPSSLDYAIELGRDWTTIRGTIAGFVGGSTVEQTIVRDASGWSVNGERVRDPALEGVEDLDLGFTPATNFAQVKRIHLGVGQAADFSVAWWDVGEPTLVALPQHYERRNEWRYWYMSPDSSYEAELEFSPSGFVRHYPRLWMLESGPAKDVSISLNS